MFQSPLQLFTMPFFLSKKNHPSFSSFHLDIKSYFSCKKTFVSLNLKVPVPKAHSSLEADKQLNSASHCSQLNTCVNCRAAAGPKQAGLDGGGRTSRSSCLIHCALQSCLVALRLDFSQEVLLLFRWGSNLLLRPGFYAETKIRRWYFFLCIGVS